MEQPQHIMDHQQDILYALRLSLEPKNNHQIRAATQMLEILSQMKGYVPTILKILVDGTTQEQIIWAALAQLKNFLRLRAYFSRTNYKQKKVLDQQDHLYLVNHIFQITVKMSSHYKFTKIIKDIIVIIGKDCEEIVPIICNYLEHGQQIGSCLNFMLGLSDAFIMSCEMQKITIFMNILKKMVPILTNMIKTGQHRLAQLYDEIAVNPSEASINQYKIQKDYFEEILYMSIKFMSKAIIRDFTEDLRTYACSWAEICINRLNENIDYHHESTNLQSQCGNRGSTTFYYFHGKKWAAKYLRMFIERLMLTKIIKNQSSLISKTFFQKNGQALVTCVQMLFLHKQPKKVRYNQLRFVHALVKLKFQLLRNLLMPLQLQILPDLMLMEQDDIQLAIQNPSQFYFKENNTKNQYENIRIEAFDIWVALVLKDLASSKQKPQQKQSVEHLIQIIKVIQCWIKQQSIKKLSVALYILISFYKHIKHYVQLHELFKELMLQCFPTLLYVDLYILRLLALDMIICYGIYLHESRVAEVKGYILDLICNDKFLQMEGIETLQIKAVLAVKKISYFQSNRQFQHIDDSQLKKILDKMIQFVRLYQIQEIMNDLNLFVNFYSTNLMPYTEQVVHNMMKIVINCIQKQTEQENESKNYQNQDYQIIGQQALDVIKSLIPLVFSSHNNHLLELLQQTIVSMTIHILLKEEGEELSFFQHISYIICSFLNYMHMNIKKISSNLLFLYQYFICKISILTQQNIDKINFLHLRNQEKQMLKTCNKIYQINYQIYFILLRHFIRFIDVANVPVRRIAQIRNSIFQANHLELFFSCIAEFYNKSNIQRSTSDVIKGKLLVCHLLLAFYECYGGKLEASCEKNVFMIIKSNGQSKYAIKYLQKVNMQLFCLWLWSNQIKSIQYLQKYPQLIKNIFAFQKGKKVKKLKNYEQLRRMILGLTELIKLSFYEQIIANCIEHYLFCIFKYLKQMINFQNIDHNMSNEPQLNNEISEIEEQNMHSGRGYENTLILQEANFVIQIPTHKNQLLYHGYNNRQVSELEEFLLDQYCEEQYVSPLDSQDELVHFLKIMVQFHNANPQYYDSLVAQFYNKQLIEILDSADLLKDNMYSCLFKAEEMQIGEIFNVNYDPSPYTASIQKEQQRTQ